MLLPDERPLKPAKSPVLASSPLQTKPPSTPRIHSSSAPTSAYQAYRQGERDSSPVSKPKPSVHPHLPSGHISSPPRPAVRKESEWSPADEKVATHRAQTKLKTSPPAKPSKPLVTHEDDARETRRLQNQVSAARQSSPPKPAPGTAGDLAAATRSRQEAVRNLEAAKSLPASLNRGGIRQMEIRDAQSSLSAADARQKSASADKELETAKSQPTSLNRGGRRQEEINYARQTASSAKTAYLGSQGLDSSGKPFVVTPPKPPAPDKHEEKPWWKKGLDIGGHVLVEAGKVTVDAVDTMPGPLFGIKGDLEAVTGTNLDTGQNLPGSLKDRIVNRIRSRADLALDFVPVISNVKGAQQAITGTDLVTGQDLSTADRWLSGISAIPGGVVVKALSKLGKGIRGIRGAEDSIKAEPNAIDGTDKLPNSGAIDQGNTPKSGSKPNSNPSSEPPQSFSAGGSRNPGFNHSLTSDEPRLAIEARPHRPAIEASPQAWKEQRAKSEIESSSSSSHDHGHSRHGAQTSLAQHELRVRTGETPDGKIDKKLPDRSTRFDSHELEKEARNRVQEQLRGTPTVAVNAQGEATLKLSPQPIVVDGPASGYGSGVELQTSPTGRATYQVNSAGEATPLPGPTTRYTGQDPHALAVPKYNWADRKWELVTIYPTNKPVT